MITAICRRIGFFGFLHGSMTRLEISEVLAILDRRQPFARFMMNFMISILLCFLVHVVLCHSHVPQFECYVGKETSLAI